MFYNACGLYIVFREIEMGGFDTLVSVFIEETRDMATNTPIYVNHELDSTFVHGKIHRRQYLIDNNIRWNEKLTIHEDSYFNCLCQKMTTDVKYCEIPFYLWKWRDSSVCRHDPKYILKTYNNMIDSNTELVLQFLQRGKNTEAFTCIALMVYDAYFTMNKNEWLNQENKEYRKNTELRFQEYWLRFRNLFFSTSQEIKNQVVMGTKNRMYAEGLIMESITFEQWIKEIENIH
jgi:predicted AlkP superfamily pyrophosphatase or phosphodiesterase